MARKDHGTVTVTRYGKQYKGGWLITGRLLTVSHFELGVKTTQVGGSARSPQGLATIMLGELISDNEPQEKAFNQDGRSG